MMKRMASGLWGTVIGVDLGTRLIKACQRSGHGWRTLTITRQRDDAFTDSEIGQLVRAIARRGMGGTRVAVSVPQSSVVSARASTPRENSGAPIAQIAQQELARVSGAEPGSLLSTSWSARSKRSRGELDERQVFGCPTQLALSLHHAFAMHGMDMIALEPGVIAATRGGFEAAGLSGEAGLIVDLGWSSARLIAAENGRLVYERGMPGLGTHQLAAGIAEACSRPEHHAWIIGGLMASRGGLDAIISAQRAVAGVIERFADELMIEIERGVAFAGERYSVATERGVLITGGGAMGGIGEALVSLGGGLLIPAGDDTLPPIHAAARGLATIMEGAHATREPAV